MSERVTSRGDWIDGFRVLIVYTEPEFRLRNPDSPAEFKFSIRYGDASTPQEAVARAMEEYQSCYENSWVSWRRVLKSVLVTPCERTH
jgi:hypothetical protein